MAFLYILECTDGTLYTGIAADIKKRMAEHREGGAKCARYTRAHPYRELRIYWETDSLAHAAKGEYAVKQLPRPQKLKLIAEPELLKELCPRLKEYPFSPQPAEEINLHLKKLVAKEEKR